MKKKLFSTALIIAALVGFNMSAQEPANSAEKACTENAQCHKGEKGKKDKDFKKDRGDRKGPRGEFKGQRPDLFKGITLTAEQQAQLEALRPQRPEGKDNCDSVKCTKGKDAGCDKAKTDKKDGTKQFRDGGRRGNPGAKKAEYVKKVKEILTPEQYVVFLENIVFSTPDEGAPAPRHDGKPRHDKKAPKDGKEECAEDCVVEEVVEVN